MKQGLGVVTAVRSFKSAITLGRNRYTTLGIAALADIAFVFVFYTMLWWFFAPRINNALADILESGQVMQQDFTPQTLMVFNQDITALIYVLIIFLLVLFFVWSLFQSYVWQQVSTMFAKKKHGYWHFFVRILNITGIFLIPISATTILTAKLTFGKLPLAQIIVLGSGALVNLILIYFMTLAYCALVHDTTKKGAWRASLTATRTALKLGVRYLFGFLLLFGISTFWLMVIDIVLRLITMLSGALYLLAGILLVFPFLVFVRVYQVQYVKSLL